VLVSLAAVYGFKVAEDLGVGVADTSKATRFDGGFVVGAGADILR
jgi:hypothetical protein